MTPPPADDAGTQLLSRPTRRDESVESLMALHDRDVRSALRRVLGRSQEEDDLVQEVFTRLVVRLRQPGEIVVGAWVRGVARNLAVDEIRRRRPVPVEQTRLDRSYTTGADDALAGDELYNCLVEGANGLPERQRAALAAALSGGSGVATVASSLGVSVHAAESLLSRARCGLRSHLAGAGADTGSTRLCLGVVLAGMAATMAWLVRRWRTVAVATVATGALTLTSAAWLPALRGPAAPAGSLPVAVAAGAAVGAGSEPGPEGRSTAGSDGEAHGSSPSAADDASPATNGAPPVATGAVVPALPLPGVVGDVTLPDACTPPAVVSPEIPAPATGLTGTLADATRGTTGGVVPPAGSGCAVTSGAPTLPVG